MRGPFAHIQIQKLLILSFFKAREQAWCRIVGGELGELLESKEIARIEG